MPQGPSPVPIIVAYVDVAHPWRPRAPRGPGYEVSFLVATIAVCVLVCSGRVLGVVWVCSGVLRLNLA